MKNVPLSQLVVRALASGLISAVAGCGFSNDGRRPDEYSNAPPLQYEGDGIEFIYRNGEIIDAETFSFQSPMGLGSLGRISVQTNPSGASIEIDGKKWPRTTKADLAVEPGQYIIKVGNGATFKEHQISVKSGQVVSIKEDL